METITATLERRTAETSYGFGLGTAVTGQFLVTSVKDDGIAAKAGYGNFDIILGGFPPSHISQPRPTLHALPWFTWCPC